MVLTLPFPQAFSFPNRSPSPPVPPPMAANPSPLPALLYPSSTARRTVRDAHLLTAAKIWRKVACLSSAEISVFQKTVLILIIFHLQPS